MDEYDRLDAYEEAVKNIVRLLVADTTFSPKTKDNAVTRLYEWMGGQMARTEEMVEQAEANKSEEA